MNSTNEMSKHWMITSFKEDFVIPEGVEYSCYQREVCPDTQREHWQAYVICSTRKRFATVQKMFPGDHLEKARANSNSCMDYCMKVQTRLWGPYQYGIAPCAKKQSILEDVKMKGAKRVLEEQPTLWRSLRALQAVEVLFQNGRDTPTKTLLFHGKTGTGKSKIANLIGSYLGQLAQVEGTMQWFDGYSGEDLCLIEEVREIRNISQFLRITDRYAMRVPVKGGYVNWRPSWLILTTNLTPEALYGGFDKATQDAIKRRLTIMEVY